jgi:hypothetical protein
MIQDSEFSPFRDFSLGVQERRAQSEHGDQTIMIRGVQHQHDGSSWRLAWDPGITVFDSSTTDTDEMASFHFLEFTLGMHRIGCLEEWSSEELTEFLQLRISWLIRGSQVGSCVSTLQISAMGRGCFTSYRLVWDPGDFTTYRKIRERFAWRDFCRRCVGRYGGVYDLSSRAGRGTLIQ